MILFILNTSYAMEWTETKKIVSFLWPWETNYTKKSILDLIGHNTVHCIHLSEKKKLIYAVKTHNMTITAEFSPHPKPDISGYIKYHHDDNIIWHRISNSIKLWTLLDKLYKNQNTNTRIHVVESQKCLYHVTGDDTITMKLPE